MLKAILGSAVLLACTMPLMAQNTPPATNPGTNPPAQNRPARPGGETCWQQAGIDQSVMEQMHSIARNARSEVEAACSNSSLAPQQRNQQAREIREKAMLKRQELITADQEKTLRACQQERRSENHSGNGGMHEGHEGMGGRGCGEMPRGGSHPGTAPNGSGNGGNPPAPTQSSPQN